MAKGSTKLIDQSQALDSFFESLMRDVEAYEENEQQPHVEPEKEPADLAENNVINAKLKLEIPEPVIEQEVEKKVDVRIFELICFCITDRFDIFPVREVAINDYSLRWCGKVDHVNGQW